MGQKQSPVVVEERRRKQDSDTLCVERDIYGTRSGGLSGQAKGDRVIKCGCENGNWSELTLRGDQHWHESYRWFSNKIEWSQTLGQPWAGPWPFVPMLE